MKHLEGKRNGDREPLQSIVFGVKLVLITREKSPGMHIYCFMRENRLIRLKLKIRQN